MQCWGIFRIGISFVSKMQQILHMFMFISQQLLFNQPRVKRSRLYLLIYISFVLLQNQILFWCYCSQQPSQEAQQSAGSSLIVWDPWLCFAQPQSGVCQASLANSSSEIAAVPSWAWHYSQNFTNNGRQFSFCRVFIYTEIFQFTLESLFKA